ncbi:MAG: hypothetical protein GYA57_06800 [Myxococcales bacterium]|nr:hypothetical protein [Myxococcales bacterium]
MIRTMLLVAVLPMGAVVGSQDLDPTGEPSPSERDAYELPATPPFEFEGGTFSLVVDGLDASLVYRSPVVERSARVTLVPPSELGRILGVHYGVRWSVVVSERCVTIMMGAADVAAGRDKLPESELFDSYCVVLPEPPVGSAFVEDAVFLFYGGGVMRVVRIYVNSDRMWKLTELATVSPESAVVRSRGVYFLLQAGPVPVVAVAQAGDGPLEAQEYEWPDARLTRYLGVDPRDDGLLVHFETETGPADLRIRVPEEAEIDSIVVRLRRPTGRPTASSRREAH